MVSRAYRPDATADEILDSLPLGTRDYIRVLGALFKKYNARHSSKYKGVSFKTMHDRACFLVGFFRELRRHTRYNNIDPRQLAGRHIQVMVKRWLHRGLATATIHNYLSFLRTFAGWIGKAGMVREPASYVGEKSEHAHRHQVADHDHSWTAKGLDIEALIAQVAATDVWAGLQLELCWRFALRPKEARHFRPHAPILGRYEANPRDAAVYPECDSFVRIEFGTKGGRLRDIPLMNDRQRELLERCRALVVRSGYVGRADRTALQNQSRFYYVLRLHGITGKDLGVVAHGLRHQRVNDQIEEETGMAPPVRGGTMKGEAADRACQRGARLLGHSRLRATSFYIGSAKSVS
jgi:integrase